ncbi:hypothetical protein MASS_1p0126 (plasmid) [Mycobacteroides abscessus subsp. bolletii 50594]|uniref:Uncharacterized protein n=2 Tax=Mycobacteriaceae TaxID=1762 RepID=A0AB33AIZ3_9MYCO|nr:hypothetical protein MASS_1p0126 [Mycobacteroides abscessus subsp. bolletii 50594]
MRTIRTAAAFSSTLYLRVVGFPGDCSFGIPASSFPRSGASGISRAIHWGLGRYVGHMAEHNLVEARLIEEIQIVVDARKPLVHWRGPLEVDSLQRVGAEAALRGEDGGEALDRHIAQLAFLCARTAMRVHFGDLTRDIVQRNR